MKFNPINNTINVVTIITVLFKIELKGVKYSDAKQAKHTQAAEIVCFSRRP